MKKWGENHSPDSIISAKSEKCPPSAPFKAGKFYLLWCPMWVHSGCLTICFSLAVHADVNRNQFWGKIQRVERYEGCLGNNRNWACQLDKVIFPAAFIKNKVRTEFYVGPFVCFITQYGTSTKLIQVYTEVSTNKNRFSVCVFHNHIYKSIFLLSHVSLSIVI